MKAFGCVRINGDRTTESEQGGVEGGKAKGGRSPERRAARETRRGGRAGRRVSGEGKFWPLF
jgi:hypothetical protein